MDGAAATKVFFRDKDVEYDWFTPYADSLLIPWMGNEKSTRSLRRVDCEIRYYRKAMDKKKFDDKQMPFFQFFCDSDRSPDLSSMFVTIGQAFANADYAPETEAGEVLDDFLSEHAPDEWRDDDNLVFEFPADDVAKLFRLSCWTLRQLEHVAEKLTAKNPHDIGIRGFFSELRTFVYDQAMKLAAAAINPAQFYEELGCKYFCPDPAVMAFWKAVGFTVTNEKTVHPIDRELKTSPPFLEMLGSVKEALSRQSRLGTLGLAERAGTARFIKEIGNVEDAWEEAMDDHFHLGPTVSLLDTTDRLLGRTKELLAKLQGSKGRADDLAAEFNDSFDAAVLTYTEASKTLADSLKRDLK